MQIEDDPNPEKEDVIQPPTIKPEFYQIRFKFFCAQKIVALDTNLTKKNSTDCYVRLEYKTTKLKTKILKIEEGSEIHWNQEFFVPAQLPLLGGRVIFRVYDHNAVQSDELIGSMHIELKDILPQKDGSPGRL